MRVFGLFFCLLASLSGRGKVGTAALLPSAAQSGDQSGSLGWAGGGGTPRGFGSALIRVIITTGTHRHTRSGICCWRRPWLLWPPPRSEVIMRPAILHCEPRISPQMLINRLLSLCVQCSWHGCPLYECVALKRPEQQPCRANRDHRCSSGIVDYCITSDSRVEGL